MLTHVPILLLPHGSAKNIKSNHSYDMNQPTTPKFGVVTDIISVHQCSD